MTRLARFRYVGSKNPVAINPVYVVRVEAVTAHPTAKQSRIHLAGGKEIDVMGDLDETVTQLDNAMAGSPSASLLTPPPTPPPTPSTRSVG
jgi:hypothetical protein